MRKIERQIISMAFLAGVIFWVADAIIDKLTKFPDAPFHRVLISDSHLHEFVIRPFVVLLFLGFGVILCLLLRKIKESQAARQPVEEALEESERQLRILTARLLKAQEQERERISRELHDELGQSLMFQKIQISFIRDGLGKKQTGLRKNCDDLLNHLEETIQEVRRLSRDLKPWGLDELGLPTAARLLIEESCRLYGIQSCQIDLDEVEGQLSPETQLNVYRIIQESLTNIGKHAHATEVSTQIKLSNGHINIRIKDNGQGFNLHNAPASEAENRGIGLSTLKERARILGGRLDIRSRKGVGTEIALSIPRNDLAEKGTEQ